MKFLQRMESFSQPFNFPKAKRHQNATIHQGIIYITCCTNFINQSPPHIDSIDTFLTQNKCFSLRTKLLTSCDGFPPLRSMAKQIMIVFPSELNCEIESARCHGAAGEKNLCVAHLLPRRCCENKQIPPRAPANSVY